LKLHLHKWRIAFNTGKYEYLECCKCGARKAREVSSLGYQPIDKDWLNHRVSVEPLPPKINIGRK